MVKSVGTAGARPLRWRISAALVSRARCSAFRAASQNRDRTKHHARYGPGSAAHRSAKCYALRCVRGTKVYRSRTCECVPIPVRKTSLILLASCPMRGASRGVTEVGQSESWPEGQPEGRCGARGRASQAWTRGALGNRPCPLRGAAFNGWTRRVKGGETCLDGEL